MGSKRSLLLLIGGFAAAAVIFLAALGCSTKEDEGVTTLVLKTQKFPDDELIRGLLDRFEAQNPGLRVRHETLPNSSDMQHQFYAMNLGGGAADFDVVSMDVIWAPEFARAGWVMDLTAKGADVKDFFPGPMRAVSFEGKLVALPWFMDSGLLYYRKDLLEKHGLEPPETFDDLVKAARTVIDAEKDADLKGFVWQGKQYEGLVCVALEFLWGNGGRVIGADGACALGRPEAAESLRFMRDLIVEHKVSPEFVTTFDEEAARHSFGNGTAVFMRNWPYCWNLFQQEGSKVKGKVGCTVVPHFEGHESAGTLGGWQLGVNVNTKHPDAAWKLVEFMTGPEAQKALAVELGFAPSRRSVYRDPEVMEKQPFIAGLEDVMAHAFPRPVTPFYPMISQVLQTEFSAAVSGRKSPEDAMAAAKKAIDAILSR